MNDCLQKFRLDLLIGGITTEVYENFVTVTVALSDEESFSAMMKGGVSAERQALRKLLRTIFPYQEENLFIFESTNQYLSWASSLAFDVPDFCDGELSKTAFFLLDGSNRKKSLEDTISYIDGRCHRADKCYNDVISDLY